MDRDPATLRAATSAAAHVTQMALLVIGGTWAGSWVDSWLHSEPWFLLLGAGGGMVSGIALLIRSSQELEPEDDDPDHPDP